MSPGLVDSLRSLRDQLAGLEPDRLTGEDCRVLAEELAATAKSCAAGAARAAARASACGAHRRAGYRDPTQWLARATGTTGAEARAALEVAGALETCPATKAALVGGSLSLTQAREITQAEAVCPGSEAELSALAATSDIATLRHMARARRLAAVDVEELHAQQRRARQFRHWRDELGMVRGSFALTPEVGIRLVNRLEAETARVRRWARRQGSTDPYEAHAADAFAALAAGDPSSGAAHANSRIRSVTELVITCDRRAWRRGHTVSGEHCGVVGGGPIPVSVAKELCHDAFVKAVVHDGVQIHTVAHFGRHIPAELRTALELGDPPDFDGVVCGEPGCGRRGRLQIDHVDPVANGGLTARANLQHRCEVHHWEKTERDRKAGLLGNSHDPP